MLETVARRLESVVREVDTVARLGGDEFALLLDGCADEASAARVIQKVRAAITEPIALKDATVSVGCSAGTIVADDANRDGAALLEEADRRMYRHKRRSARSSTQLPVPSARGLQRRMLIDQALHHGDLTPRLEPIVTVDGLQCVGYEVQPRWLHPSHGHLDIRKLLTELSPSRAWPRILHKSIESACNVLAWTGERATGLSVAIDARALCDEMLAGHVHDALAPAIATGTPLEVALTSIRLVDASRLAAVIDGLRNVELGVAIDIDADLGAFEHLLELPVDAVRVSCRIARVLSKDLIGDVLEPIVRLGERMSARIIATGVETASEAAMLDRGGVRYAQGPGLGVAPLEAPPRQPTLSLV